MRKRRKVQLCRCGSNRQLCRRNDLTADLWLSADLEGIAGRCSCTSELRTVHDFRMGYTSIASFRAPGSRKCPAYSFFFNVSSVLISLHDCFDFFLPTTLPINRSYHHIPRSGRSLRAMATERLTCDGGQLPRRVISHAILTMHGPNTGHEKLRR